MDVDVIKVQYRGEASELWVDNKDISMNGH